MPLQMFLISDLLLQNDISFMPLQTPNHIIFIPSLTSQAVKWVYKYHFALVIIFFLLLNLDRGRERKRERWVGRLRRWNRDDVERPACSRVTRTQRRCLEVRRWTGTTGTGRDEVVDAEREKGRQWIRTNSTGIVQTWNVTE